MYQGASDLLGEAYEPQSPSGMEYGTMRLKTCGAVMIAGVLMLAPGAEAQSAVEWKVSDGGNGHWYVVMSTPSAGSWTASRTAATAIGGHLVSIASVAENNFLQSYVASLGLSLPQNCMAIGAFQDKTAAGYSEPRGGWKWVDGTPWSYEGWDCRVCGGWCQPDNYIDQNYSIAFLGCEGGNGAGRLLWDDANDRLGSASIPYMLVEWDADCNGDGVVDWGQIRAGELDDSNANGIPDCCETGELCARNFAINGSFEAGTPLGACTSESIASGSALGTGWMVSEGTVQRVRASSSCNTMGVPKFGDFFVDLLSGGGIRQTIATIPGRSYRLTFWLSGDCASGTSSKRVAASVGLVTQSFDHVCSGTGVQTWRVCETEFIANSPLTTISLKSMLGGASNGPLVDGVHVEDISISCPGDVDGDGTVTGGDIGLVLLNFGECPTN